MIIFDLLEAVQDSSAVTEGVRKVVGVMLEDAAKFAATGAYGSRYLATLLTCALARRSCG